MHRPPDELGPYRTPSAPGPQAPEAAPVDVGGRAILAAIVAVTAIPVVAAIAAGSVLDREASIALLILALAAGAWLDDVRSARRARERAQPSRRGRPQRR